MKRRVTLQEVAFAAGVSTGTISNYLNQTAPVGKDTKLKIQNAINEMGYQRNEIASSLRRNHTKSLGIIVPNVSNAFYATMFQASEVEAQKRGYTISLGNIHYNRERMDEYLRLFSNKRMDGILLAAYSIDVPGDWYSDLYPPLVVIEPPSLTLPFSTVGIDNLAASYEITKYLIQKGHTRIAIIVLSRESLRFAGYQKALEENNIPIRDDMVQELGKLETDLIAQGDREMSKLLEKASFTACFATTDLLAIGAITCAKRNGIKIPEDLSIAGFDNIPLASIVDPPLTTVAQPIEEMGRIGIKLLIKQIKRKTRAKPENIILNTRIIVRASA
ncbi:MAG: LacI family transcriptional regulator [Chloroflexi bacterium]|nr:LacI family transcriptional regulator [Chloroflexota bacterium]